METRIPGKFWKTIYVGELSGRRMCKGKDNMKALLA